MVQISKGEGAALTVFQPLMEHLVTSYLKGPGFRGHAFKELLVIDINLPGARSRRGRLLHILV